MINTKAILMKVDIVALIEANLGQPEKRSGRWLFWRCPFHQGDHTPSLGVIAAEGKWFCFGCRKGGDAITWLIDYQGMSFKEACNSLADGNLQRIPQSLCHPFSNSRLTPDLLQESWQYIIKECEQMLWKAEGQRARAYMNNRGINDHTMKSKYFRTGYSRGFRIHNVWVDRGIVLPCFTTSNGIDIDYIQYIKVRRPIGNPKYRKLSGNGSNLSGLFGAEWINRQNTVFLTEGELDAMLLQQEAGHLVGVGSLGGAGERLDFARFGSYIMTARHIVIVYDNDAAGQRGAEAWQGISERVNSVQVPMGKDITEFWKAGGDLADWVQDIIGKLACR